MINDKDPLWKSGQSVQDYGGTENNDNQNGNEYRNKRWQIFKILAIVFFSVGGALLVLVTILRKVNAVPSLTLVIMLMWMFISCFVGAVFGAIHAVKIKRTTAEKTGCMILIGLSAVACVFILVGIGMLIGCFVVMWLYAISGFGF